MIYLSAGHHNADPGAVANGLKEADLTKELRDLIAKELKVLNAAYTLDKDSETLAAYIQRIRPGSGSVVCEVHFNSAGSLATGVETIVKAGADFNSRKLADEINKAVVVTCGLTNRGVKDETQSHRGRLGILNTNAGISVLPEICFISNTSDISKYSAGKYSLAKKIAALLVQFDAIGS